jgi:hypothetical protein
MLDIGHDLPLRGRVRVHLVGDHDPWRSPLPLEQLLHQPPGCFGIAATLYHHIEDKAGLIDCAPEPVFLATNCDDNFVEMPFAIELTSRTAADISGKLAPEFLRLNADRLV